MATKIARKKRVNMESKFMGYPLKINKRIDCYFFLFNSQWLTTILVIHLVHEWNIVIFPEFNELKLVFHEAQPSGIQDFNELNSGNMTIFHEWTK